jgi:hypothetical protein
VPDSDTGTPGDSRNSSDSRVGKHRESDDSSDSGTAPDMAAETTPPLEPATPRQRTDSSTARIVGRIGADRPARILAQPDPDGTSVVVTRPAPPRPPAPDPVLRTRHPALLDAAALLAFAVFAGFLTRGLWPHPSGRALALNPGDQIVTEWFLSYGARVYTGDFSLVTDRLNAPDGVNLLSNASTILLAVLLAPVTLAWGAPVSFAVAVGLNLAATAAGW